MGIDENEREQMILDAAASLIIRHGYNKVTMSDVARAVGLHRGLIYLHFKSKEALLEALITREMKNYGEIWLEHIESDPKGGTVASTYRSVLYALKRTPFLAAITIRNEGTFGTYLRKPGNIFEGLPTTSMTHGFLQAMQDAGVVRQGVNIAAMASILDTLSYSLLEHQSVGTRESTPSSEEVMETIAEMVDRTLTPEDGGNLEAGKAVLRRLADDARRALMNHPEEER